MVNLLFRCYYQIMEKPPIQQQESLRNPAEAAERDAVVRSFGRFLETKQRLNREELEDDDAVAEAYRDMTEYQFLITHFVASQAEHPEQLPALWRELKDIARDHEEQQNFSMFQRGVVTQVATHRIFKELGFAPRFAHPDEDAFKKVALWSDPKHAVQIKGSSREEFGIYKTSEVGPASTEVSDGRTRRIFDGDIRSFKTKLKSFGEGVEGYFIVIPSDKIDFTTGKPSEEIVKMVREKVGELK